MTRASLVFDLRYASAHYPGVGSYAVGLAEALLAARPGWPWRVLVPTDSRFDLSFVPESARWRLDSEPAPFQDQFRLGRLLRDSGAALYHSPYLLRPWRARCPSIVTVHDVIPLEHEEGMSGPRRAVYRWLVRDSLRASVVVTDSHVSRDTIRAAFPSADPLAVHPGCRLAEGREAWPAWPRPAVLTVGINKPHKNLDVLVRALAIIPVENRPLLVCAGPVDRRFPDALALAKRHGVCGDVMSVGMVAEDRLASLYRAATLFAFPTRLEGFGLPLLEAMTLGVPAVASDIPVLREIAGDAATFVPADDAGAWANAITSLLADAPRRATFAQRGRTRAREFDYGAAARRLVAEYERLVPDLASESTDRVREARP